MNHYDDNIYENSFVYIPSVNSIHRFWINTRTNSVWCETFNIGLEMIKQKKSLQCFHHFVSFSDDLNNNPMFKDKTERIGICLK